MNANAPDSIYGTTFDCECGRRHVVRPEEIIYSSDAVPRLPEVCAKYVAAPAGVQPRCAVLMDARTRAAAGERAAAALRAAGWQVNEVMVPDRTGGGPAGSPASGPVAAALGRQGSRPRDPVCDDVTKAALAARLGSVDLVVPVGSGVVNDLGKWLAFDAGVPFIPLATAASMNGYTSANVAPTIGGVKTLLRAAPPPAVLAEPAVIAAAPYEMTASGLGDAMAKSVSSADWRLNHLLFGDYYCARGVALITEIEPLYLDHPEAIRARHAMALAALLDALLLTGVAMTLAESSAPASGGEHLISHSLDMMSALDGRPHDLHGRQVGVATVMAAELYRRVLAIESPALRDAPSTVDGPFWGRLAAGVAEEYARKADRLRSARTTLAAGDTWDNLRADLSAMLRPPERIHNCLQAAGAACSAEDIGCPRDRLLDTFRHAHEIRPRFTILDLAHLTGILPAAAEEIVEQWA
jgi:glycerol-1-phosphate dehydrogenase [NAD(P)+]